MASGGRGSELTRQTSAAESLLTPNVHGAEVRTPSLGVSLTVAGLGAPVVLGTLGDTKNWDSSRNGSCHWGQRRTQANLRPRGR